MSDILEQLYYGEYRAAEQVSSREYRKETEEREPLWGQVREALGERAADRLWGSHRAFLRTSARDSFREGFYLGTLLMLELFYGDHHR